MFAFKRYSTKNFSAPIGNYLRSIPISSLKTPIDLRRGSIRNYATQKKEGGPRILYLVYTFAFASAVLYFAANKVEKKVPQKNSFTEKEFEEYETTTGLKRRTHLISEKDVDRYKFYAVPYVHQDVLVDALAKKLKESGRQVKVIDPERLVKDEKDDESATYSLLLKELDSKNKPYPGGLITAILKNHLNSFLNTRNGTFDTSFIIKNFPQNTTDAIKFENEVAAIDKCVVFKYDVMNELEANKGKTMKEQIEKVIMYYDTVDRVKTISQKHDELDDRLQDFSMEFI